MRGLYGRVLRNDILQGPYINLTGVSVGPLIVGYSVYPIFPWLFKPYQNVRKLDPTKVQFNTIYPMAYQETLLTLSKHNKGDNCL